MNSFILLSVQPPHINPIFRFLIYFIISVPPAVLIGTIGSKLITFTLLPWKICLGIGISLGVLLTIFIVFITIAIQNA